MDFTQVTPVAGNASYYNVVLVRDPYATVYVGDIVAVGLLHPDRQIISERQIRGLLGYGHMAITVVAFYFVQYRIAISPREGSQNQSPIWPIT